MARTGRMRRFVAIEAAPHRVSKLRWKLAQRVELAWWRRYLRGRSPDDYLRWKRAYWLDFLAVLGLTPKPNSTVLDAGCGPAGIFCALPQCAVTAVDPLLGQYKRLAHFRAARSPNVTFVEGAVEAYAPAARFDYVFCLNVINHVRDLDGVCAVLAKAARPGAPVVVSVDAHRHAWLKPVFKALPGDVLHPHQLDLDEYVAAFARSGLHLTSKRRLKRERIFDYWVLVLAAEADYVTSH